MADDAPPGPHPVIRIEITGEGGEIRIDWPQGHDLAPLAATLLALQTGRHAEDLSAAVVRAGDRVGDPDGGRQVARYLAAGLRHDRGHADDPLVLPSRAIRRLIKGSTP